MSFDFNRAIKKELNIGLKERNYRFIGGSALLLISVFLGNIFVLILGGILVATAFMRWCPVYSGLSRSSVDPNEPTPACSSGGEGHSH
jgi:hypothetical protein